LVELVVYSEGSFSWTDVWAMSAEDRDVAVTVVQKYLNAKSGKSEEML